MKVLSWVLVIVFKYGTGVSSVVIPMESEMKCSMYSTVAEQGETVVETFCFKTQNTD